MEKEYLLLKEIDMKESSKMVCQNRPSKDDLPTSSPLVYHLIPPPKKNSFEPVKYPMDAFT